MPRPLDPEISPPPAASAGFRILKCSEVVRRGDFVVTAQAGFAPWEGLNGFRADAYLKPIYRKQTGQPAPAGKLP